MPQAVWTGAISFGLVSIPVRLVPATEPKDVRFHLYDRRSGKRVRYERVTRDDEPPLFVADAPSTSDIASLPPRPAPPSRGDEDAWTPAAAPVAARDVLRGLELPSGDVVTVDEAEIDALAPERSRTIDIEEFVELAEIDPVYYEKSYYVAPGRGMGAEKPYALLHQAMRTAAMVAIGRFVLRTKPHLVAIRALDDVLALETLYFGDEVRAPREVIGPPPQAAISDRELKTARQLIQALATRWVPEKHADAYRAELLALLAAKAPRTAAEPVAAETPAVDDLMAQLKASVEAAKRSGETERATQRRRTRSSRTG